MFEVLDKRVSRLVRTRYGNITLERRQAIGRHRELREEELQELGKLTGMQLVRPRTTGRRRQGAPVMSKKRYGGKSRRNS